MMSRPQTNTKQPITKKIKISNIRLHEYDITIPLAKRIRTHTNMCSANSIPRLQVGCWGVMEGAVDDLDNYKGTYYILTESDAYRGVVRSGRITKCECLVHVFESESDFLAQHAILNHLPTGYDPLKLGRVVRRLQGVSQETGATESASARRAVDHIIQSCTGTVDQKFIALNLDDEAARIISSMCEWLGEKLTRFDLPYYIPHAVSKVARGMQGELAEQISLVVRSGSVTDARFSWPAPEEIEVMADTPLFRGEDTAHVGGSGYDEFNENRKKDTNSNNVTFVVPEAPPSVSGGRGSGNAAASAAPTGKKSKPVNNTNRDGSVLLPNTKDAMIIQGDEHAPYVVDLRTKRVSVVDERPDVTVLREIGEDQGGKNQTASKSRKRPAYLMPHAACEWLLDAEKDGSNTEAAANVNMFMFNSPSDLERFVKKHKTKKQVRGVIIYK